MDLNNITSGSWGNEANKINLNFNKINAETIALQGIANGGGKLFASVADVNFAYPKPIKGLYALVSTTLTFPATVYQYNGTEWIAGGTSNGGDAIENIVASLNSKIVQFEGQSEVLLMSQKAVTDLVGTVSSLIHSIVDNGFHVSDADGNVVLRYNDDGFDVAAISTHMQGLIKDIDGLGLALGETSLTAYAGDKGKANATAIATLLTSLQTLTSNNNTDHNTYHDGIVSLQNSLSALTTSNSGAHNTFSTAISALQGIIRQIAENGFNVIDENGNIGMKYDNNGLDAALLSSHFQSLINSLVSTVITSAKGTTLAPLVNSLIPAVFLPSFVDDAIEIDLFGTGAIAQYCTDNEGNTETLSDKFSYDNENKVFVIARQFGTSIDLVEAGSPEKGKIYTDTVTNKTYRWGGTTMVPIGSDMVLGETSATAYPGDKGKQNADAIVNSLILINRLSKNNSTLTSILQKIAESGYNVADGNGNIGMKYDNNGLDAALLSTHFQALIKEIEGIGDSQNLIKRILQLEIKAQNIIVTYEPGIFFIDENYNIGAEFSADLQSGFGGSNEIFSKENDIEYDI